MIFDDDDPDVATDTVDDLDQLDDLDGGDGDDASGEWLGGLRAAGLPVRAIRPLSALVAGAETVAGVTAAQLVGESWAPCTLAAYEASWARFASWCHVIGHLADPLDADNTTSPSMSPTTSAPGSPRRI